MLLFRPAVVLLGLVAFTTYFLESESSSPYADCATNFKTLEKALVETSDNKYELEKTFFLPRHVKESIYVTVTYAFLDEYGNDSNCTTKWIWSITPVFLIQPPRVFQYMSLFFSYNHGQVAGTTLKLPFECRKLLTTECNCQERDEKLDVLTQKLKLYAQFNDLDHIEVSDSLLPSIICNDREELKDKYEHTDIIIVFLTCAIFIPFFFIFLLIMVARSLLPPIRARIVKPKNHPNLAALAWTGFVLTMFIAVADGNAIWETVANDECCIHVHSYSLIFVFITCGMDFVAIVVGAGGLFYLRMDDCCGKLKCCKCGKCCECVNRCCFCCCFFPLFGGIDLGAESEGNYRYEEDDRKMEVKLWILTLAFIAPFFSIVLHIGYILLAFGINSQHAVAVSLFAVLSFFYYFFIFRQLYIAFLDIKIWPEFQCLALPVLMLCGWIESCYASLKPSTYQYFSLNNPSAEEDTYHQKLSTTKFNFKSFFMDGYFAILLMGVEGFVVIAFLKLPVALDYIPGGLLSLVHLAFLAVTVLITYKVLSIHEPKIKHIFKKLVEVYKGNDDQAVEASDDTGAAGEIMGKVARALVNKQN